MFRFEKLDVWQKAIDYAGRVYEVTREFPNDERFGLISQMRRASVSVSSNLAEGSARTSDLDFAYTGCLWQSTRCHSFCKLVWTRCGFGYSATGTQKKIAKIQKFIQDGSFDELYQRADQLARMLSGLRSTLLKHGNS